MTTYIKTPASEPPKEEREYFVIKEVAGKEIQTQEWFNGKSFQSANVKHWLKPITSEAMSLEQAKDKVAHDNGWHNWQELDENESMGTAAIMSDRAAELYLSSNTAALREENDRLKSDLLLRDVTMLPAKDAELDTLQQQVKTLAGKYRSIQEAIVTFVTRRDLGYDDAGLILFEAADDIETTEDGKLQMKVLSTIEGGS